MGVENNSVLHDLAAEERDSPSHYNENNGRYMYHRRNLGDLKGPPGIPKIGDLGVMRRLTTTQFNQIFFNLRRLYYAQDGLIVRIYGT